MKKKIKDLGFNDHTKKCLIEFGITKLGEFLHYSPQEINKIPGIARGSLVDIIGVFKGLKIEEAGDVITKTIVKEVVKENIVYLDKIEYVLKHVETIMPTPKKCLICHSFPLLEYVGGFIFTIKCHKCGTSVKSNNTGDLFPELFAAINKWNELGAHLTPKEN